MDEFWNNSSSEFEYTLNVTVENFSHHQGHPSRYQLPGLVKFSLYVGSASFLISLLFNFLVAMAFFKRPRLITPFTIQFLNFVVIQLALLIFDGPLNIVSRISTGLFLNPSFCAVFKFGAWTFPSLALLQQMAIGVDRWAALLVPVWYRTKTVKFGVLVTLGIVVGYLILYIPLFIVDTVAGMPTGVRCDTHRELVAYQYFVRFLTYYLPLGFTFVSYPVLLVILQRRRNAQLRPIESRARRLTAQLSAYPVTRSHKIGPHSVRNDIYTLGLDRTSVDLPVPPELPGITARRFKLSGGRKKINLSMWMMLVQIVCSLPLVITYTLVQYTHSPGSSLPVLPYLDDINVFNIVLSTVNVLIDPIMYWIFFKDLRAETVRLVRCQRE